MDSKTDTNCLVELGLTNYEARIYLSLMQKNQLSATEIARIAKIPRTRVYDDLKSLESKGLCQAITGKKKLFLAVDPLRLRDVLVTMEEEKIEVKKRKLELKLEQDKEALSEKTKNIDSLVERLSPIYSEYQEQDFTFNYVELMRGHYHVDNRYQQLLGECKNEVVTLISFKLVGLNKELMEEIERQVDLGAKRISKGLSARSIYEVIPDNPEHDRLLFEKIINKSAAAGERIRVMENVPMRMSIFDEKICMFTLVDEMRTLTSYVTQVIKNRMMANTLKLLFEFLWDKAEDFNEYKKRMIINR